MSAEEKPVRGRFAPTPSGRMHLGNVLCALLAWLSARSRNGSIVLRIEDLDAEHCPRAYADLIEEDLRWLGLDWDEGGSGGGPAGSYYQSERTAVYRDCFDRLQKQELLYPCFCGRAELHAARAPHLSDGNVLYPGTCRGLTPAEAARRAQRRSPAMRLRVPAEELSFCDLHYGPCRTALETECGDFIVRRSDGVHAYQLAVVADDALMGVTEVVRGRDLLPATTPQLLLYRLLGFAPPAFGHVPLLLDADGRRLSKRDHDLGLGPLRARLKGPEPLIGMLAHLCGLTEREEPVAAAELIPLFSWERIPRGDLRLPDTFRRELL